ncbi:MAG TPA: hypothetical protein VG407_06740 [Caulobacteraceae bacterium]|nr:hypothetical protein [Caulobacteraceae bacterium]
MKTIAISASLFTLALAASPAHAGVTYTGCLRAADPSLCIVGKAIAGTGALPWTERMDDLVEAGDVERAAKLAAQVRPLSSVLSDLHAIPSDNDIAAVEDVDPGAAKILRDNDTDILWQRYVAAHGADLATRTLPPASVAGFALAAAAYRSPEPFADPIVQPLLAAATKTPADEEQMLLRAMRSIRPAGRPYAVAPAGLHAVLDRAKALARPSAEFDAAFAEFAWWAGDDAAVASALDRLKSNPAAEARHWSAVARMLAAVGRPAEAQALVDANGRGRDRMKAELAIGAAWLAKGDKARALAAAHAALGAGGDDPQTWTAATVLIDRAGDHAGALSTAQAFAAGAEGGDPAQRSTGLASASQALAAIGANDEACRAAHRALQVANDSAAAQVAAWKHKYQGSQVPLDPWYGVDFSGDPIPVDDVRDAFRERAAAALEACGATDEAAKARGDARASSGAWRAIAPVEDASLTPAQRLKTEAALVASDPKLAARLADAAALAPEPEDPVAKLMWRDAQAYALAAAGRGEPARAMAASAVRGLDEMSNPDDQQTVALVLAKDHRAVDALAAGAAFGRTLPE